MVTRADGDLGNQLSSGQDRAAGLFGSDLSRNAVSNRRDDLPAIYLQTQTADYGFTIQTRVALGTFFIPGYAAADVWIKIYHGIKIRFFDRIMCYCSASPGDIH